MKVITIEGEYGYNLNEKIEGLMVFYHFETFDGEKELSSAANKLYKKIKGKRVILIPFSHLSNDVKEYNDAEILHYKFIETFKSRNIVDIYISPFGKPKGLFIQTPNVADVKYYQFEPDNKKIIKNIYTEYINLYNQHMLDTGHYDAQIKLVKSISEYIVEPIIDLGAGTGFLVEEILKMKNKL